MILRWLKDRRRSRLLAQPFAEAWSRYLEKLPFYAFLDHEEQRELRNVLRVLVAEKQWVACGGMDVTDEVKVTIAAQAALLILNIEHDYYRRVSSILIYPSAFVVPRQHVGPGGLVEEGAIPVAGLAQHGGPVVLAWDAAKSGGENAGDGRNVVLHEFAHKLDMLDHVADGTPPLEGRDQYEAWHRIMTREYQALIKATDKGRATLLDAYAATDPAEFFAVATECFFEQPKQMLKKHPELYALFSDYYRQDPAARAGRRR